RRRARDRNPGSRSVLRAGLSGLCADRGLGRRAGLDLGVVRRLRPHWSERHCRKILRAAARRFPDLSGDDVAADVAAARVVRKALARPEPALPADPYHYLRRQARWHPLEFLFWLAAILPFLLFPNYLSLASQVAIAALFALSVDPILGYA